MNHYDKSDRRALIVLAIFAAVLAVVVWITSRPVDTTAETSVSVDTDSVRNNTVVADTSSTTVVPPTSFDPNTVDSATLVLLGLKPNQARSFIRYRNAGAVFRTPLDIAHVYSLEDSDIDRLLPLVSIASQYQHRRTKYPIGQRYERDTAPADYHDKSDYSHHRPDTTSYSPRKFTQPTTIDPNTADTALLQRIPGIGRNIATWIVRHRDRLGGFHSVSQLLEVRYVEPSMLQWFEIKSDSLRHINLNTMTFAQLSSHPYIGYDRAKAISNRRRLYGPFTDIQALRATGFFTDDTLQLLAPYLEY